MEKGTIQVEDWLFRVLGINIARLKTLDKAAAALTLDAYANGLDKVFSESYEIISTIKNDQEIAKSEHGSEIISALDDMRSKIREVHLAYQELTARQDVEISRILDVAQDIKDKLQGIGVPRLADLGIEFFQAEGVAIRRTI